MGYLNKKQLKQIEKFVKKRLDTLNYMHVMAVRPIARYLAVKEKANKQIVDLSVLFHDITKPKLEKELYHHKEGADIAKNFLKKIKADKKFIDAVYHCVLAHSTPLRYFRDKAKKAHKNKDFLPWPKTKEAKILFDADMIQQISPFGIAKGLFISYSTYKKGFKKGFLSVKKTLMEDAYKNIFTKTGKKLAKERIKYIKDFFNKLENE
jgi:HD superfamily phosphodiesterase